MQLKARRALRVCARANAAVSMIWSQNFDLKHASLLLRCKSFLKQLSRAYIKSFRHLLYFLYKKGAKNCRSKFACWRACHRAHILVAIGVSNKIVARKNVGWIEFAFECLENADADRADCR